MKQAAIGLIFNETKTQILLIKRRDVPVWVLPGGGVDKAETPDQAIIREIQEETGLHTTIQRKIAEYSPLNRLAEPTHFFECTQIDGNLQLSDETQDIRFFALSELPSSFFIVHRDWLQDALLNEPVLIKKAITRVTYWEVWKYFCSHPLQVLSFIFTCLKSKR